MLAHSSKYLKQQTIKKWRGSFLDFVNLITTVPSRHSGDQVHKVDFFPHCTKRGWKGEERVPLAFLLLGGKEIN